MSLNNSLRLGVLCSGRGSNLASIIEAIASGKLMAQVVVVIADKSEAKALQKATEVDIPAIAVNRKSYANREDFERELLKQLQEYNVDLVVLAGFMRILSPYFVRAYSGRIMNIHPALLPSFPGAHSHADALDYGVKVSGCTVHFVDEGTDSGPIILQAAVPVLESDTEESLAARILIEEHRIYPQAIDLYARGKLKVIGRRVLIEE